MKLVVFIMSPVISKSGTIQVMTRTTGCTMNCISNTIGKNKIGADFPTFSRMISQKRYSLLWSAKNPEDECTSVIKFAIVFPILKPH
jgi:hypothetical protein